MSNNYQQYGGNPYGNEQQSYGGGQQQGYGGQQQSYGGQQQSYGGGQQQYSSPYQNTQDTAPTHQGYDGSAQGYGAAAPLPSILSNPDFLTRVTAVRKEIEGLSENISQIASLHQRAISSPDNSGSAQLEHVISQTQILNTHIKDQIKYLETDAARSGGNVTKDSQVRNLKNQFKNRLEQYQQEEVQYKKRYQEQIARQYRIVNPNADDNEVAEAVDTDWGNEGIFQTAVSCFFF
jgi:syntaxin 1B/2/3